MIRLMRQNLAAMPTPPVTRGFAGGRLVGKELEEMMRRYLRRAKEKKEEKKKKRKKKRRKKKRRRKKRCVSMRG